MGYLVNGQCYEDKINADDAFFGGSKPIITADGKPMMFQRLNDGWYLNSEKVKASFPQCSPEQNFQDGFTAGMPILAAVSVLVIIGRVAKMF